MNFLTELINKKKDIFKKENVSYLTVIFLIFLFDRLSKLNIINNYNESIYYINDFINIDLVWNTGIGFGFFSSTSSFLYNIITSLIGVIISILLGLILFVSKTEKYIFSLIIGGALGNFYDRLTTKAVPDFIDLHYNSIHWFTFNVADIFISLGIIILIIKGSPKKNNEKK